VAEITGNDAAPGDFLYELANASKSVGCPERRVVGMKRLIGSPSMIGEGAFPAELSKPFLLKINFMTVRTCKR
jgi:hypothetical protein